MYLSIFACQFCLHSGKGGKPEFLHDMEGEMNGGGEFGVEVDQEVEERRKVVPKGGPRGAGGRSKKREGKVSHINSVMGVNLLSSLMSVCLLHE